MLLPAFNKPSTCKSLVVFTVLETPPIIILLPVIFLKISLSSWTSLTILPLNSRVPGIFTVVEPPPTVNFLSPILKNIVLSSTISDVIFLSHCKSPLIVVLVPKEAIWISLFWTSANIVFTSLLLPIISLFTCKSPATTTVLLSVPSIPPIVIFSDVIPVNISFDSSASVNISCFTVKSFPTSTLFPNFMRPPLPPTVIVLVVTSV